nr:tRNA lysidine(34) synthetase TilS [Rhizobium sp. ACO-34A]
MDHSHSPESAASGFLDRLSGSRRLLVAISGGSDSTGLLIALDRAIRSRRLPHSLTAVTIDHLLRAESTAEAEAVGGLCASLGIPHRTIAWNDKKPKTGISAAAREARYRLLTKAATEFATEIIVTGHTLDDQEETVAMRATRAADDNLGLAGMAKATLLDRRFWLLRPFLSVRRQDIRDYLHQLDLDWIDDPSNEDRKYERVRMRQDRHPIDPDAIRAAGVERTERSRQAATLIRAHATSYASLVVKLPPEEAHDLQSPAFQHALSTLCAVAGGRSHRPGRDSMDRLISFLATGRIGRITLSRALVERRKDGLFLMRENRDISPLEIPAGETAEWDGRFRITNRGTEMMLVTPGQSSLSANDVQGLSDGLVRHLHRISPSVTAGKAIVMPMDTSSGLIDIEPCLPLFDRFLPSFDLDLANAVAGLMGRKDYCPPPFNPY